MKKTIITFITGFVIILTCLNSSAGNDTECLACVKAHCADEVLACHEEAGCAEVVACVARCGKPGLDACVKRCFAPASAFATVRATDVIECKMKQCPKECFR